jgi:hypothetical protein
MCGCRLLRLEPTVGGAVMWNYCIDLPDGQVCDECGQRKTRDIRCKAAMFGYARCSQIAGHSGQHFSMHGGTPHRWDHNKPTTPPSTPP